MKLKKKEKKKMENEKQAKMAPPWVQYANAVNALFEKDGEVDVIYNNDDMTLSLMVENPVKADALQQLMPTEKKFGSVTLKIRVVPANLKMTKAQLYNMAFSGNPAFVTTVPIEGVFTNPLLYVVFEKAVVQYFNDDLGDLHGNRSTLYQELAKEVFEEHDGVMFCTDANGENIGKPLGSWPEA